nr:transposase [Xanthomonadales bacterium]NIX12180.1 hypothetical protein [Xanthomonadales bacterium]
HSAYQVAEIYAYRGDVEEAFRWLNIAFDQHDGGLQEIKGNPLLRPLHQDPRWPQFMTMMNLPL